MPNRLVNTTSPYLRQHQENPVDWFPWEKTALDKAKRENKPIFLSIGYAACHWCHVMAHESFDDVETASLLNQHFVSIKVDREERPDLDDIYMQAVVVLTGQGGWPLSVFLTPELKPFYGGTYFPPEPRYGMPSFKQVLMQVVHSWENQQEVVANNAAALTDAISEQISYQPKGETEINTDEIVKTMYRSYDWQDGGWHNAPKFPQAMAIEFLIQRGLRGDALASQLSDHILSQMALGGMYDHVGGGFHRYSTDAEWLVPHFEKMLYDNAQLARTYLHGFLLTGNQYFRYIAEETLSFMMRELRSPEGGFYSSLDADTKEGEGRYYAWTKAEIDDLLTKDQRVLFTAALDLSEHGNFDDGLNLIRLRKNIDQLSTELNVSLPALIKELRTMFSKLQSWRMSRPIPETDRKIIVEWNALAIRAFAEGGIFLNRKDYLDIAEKAAKFIFNEMISSDGSLARSWFEGDTNQKATLADHAGMILGCHSLYQANFKPGYFQWMKRFKSLMEMKFGSENALYFDSDSDLADLIIRPQNLQDNATPSGNALAAHANWLMGNYEHNISQLDRVNEMLKFTGGNLSRYPTSFGYWLSVANLSSHMAQQVALVSEKEGTSLKPFIDIYQNKLRPHSILAVRTAEMKNIKDLPAILKDKPPVDDRPTAYICKGFVCQAPLTDLKIFEEGLSAH